MTDQIYQAPEQKVLRYKKPDGSIPINGSSLLFAKYSFWQFENRIDIRKYFVTKFENGKNPEINSKLMPGKKGLCLTFVEAVELVKALKAMLHVAKFCPADQMEPDDAMIQIALDITDLGGKQDSMVGRKRQASDCGSTLLLEDNDDGGQGIATVSSTTFECSQALE